MDRTASHVRQNAVAYLALFIALGGTTAFAASQITGKEIKNESVKSKDLKDNSAAGRDLKDGSARVSPPRT